MTHTPTPLLRIYVWEGNGISDAYHDNGTLVVLAESPEQARAIVRAKVQAIDDEWSRERDRLADELGFIMRADGAIDVAFWKHPASVSLGERWPQVFDGSDEALDRQPDRVLETDQPAWVAFNGGGYD